MAPTNSTPSMPMAMSMTLSAVAYAVSLSVPSGMFTVTCAVFDVIVGTMVMPMFTTPTTATPSNATETTSGMALWRKKNARERAYFVCSFSNQLLRRGT